MLLRPLPTLCCTAALAAAALAATPAVAQRLAPPIEAALQREHIPLEALSVVVQEVGSGSKRLSLQADKPVNPASLLKLLTTYAALEQLGPAFTWKTPVWLTGRIGSDGVLEGNVHLQGRGDPKLTLERLWLLMLRLRQMGLVEIRGDIVLDQSAFAQTEGSTAEFDNEPLRPYNARPQALLLNLNTLVYTFSPEPPRGVARVSVEPKLAGMPDASVPLAEGPCVDWRTALRATPGEPEGMRFGGNYALACGERSWPLAYPDSRLYAARLLATLWRDAGGRLIGTVREGPVPEGATLGFEFSSPSLAEVVRDINKFSNNVMAQQLMLSLALQRPGATQATPEDGREALRQWLTQRQGETLEGVVIDNGSGLSRQTRLSAALLARLLQAAWASPVMPELLASLPVNGLDGTLRQARHGAGQAHLKTGSLRDVLGIAGVVLGASGKRYVLVAVVNHPHALAARPALDALVRWTIDDLPAGPSSLKP